MNVNAIDAVRTEEVNVNLTERGTGQELHLTGSTAPFSPEAKGDKAVLAAL